MTTIKAYTSTTAGGKKERKQSSEISPQYHHNPQGIYYVVLDTKDFVKYESLSSEHQSAPPG